MAVDPSSFAAMGARRPRRAAAKFLRGRASLDAMRSSPDVGPTHVALAESIVVYPCERRAPRPERTEAMPSRRPTLIHRRRFDLAGVRHTAGVSRLAAEATVASSRN